MFMEFYGTIRPLMLMELFFMELLWKCYKYNYYGIIIYVYGIFMEPFDPLNLLIDHLENQ